MNIWLFNPSGNIPGESWRPYRNTFIGEVLAEHGHNVTWWTSNFSHYTKEIRPGNLEKIAVSKGFNINIIPTVPYFKHVSFNRLLFFLLYSYRLYFKTMQEENPPDCIITTTPAPGLDYISVKIARHFGAKHIVDIMDLWPELFDIMLPQNLKPLTKVLSIPFHASRKYLFNNVDAVTALSDAYRDIGKMHATKDGFHSAITIFDGIDVSGIRQQAQNQSNNLPISKKSGEIWAVYSGTLGNNYDIDTILDASVKLSNKHSKIKIIIAGDGPLKNKVEEFINSFPIANLAYLGRMQLDDLYRIYKKCSIGICPYLSESTVTMPAKIYDYFAFGLPIASSLTGELKNILGKNQAGVTYNPGNPDSLVETLENIAGDKGRWSKMSKNAYKLGTEFDGRAQYRKFVTLIEEICSPKKG